MPKLKPDTQLARRTRILDAAEVCFARSGFHRTTMSDICGEAGVSAGALYVHFPSKEALIAGIAERNRMKLAGELAELAQAPDLLAALSKLGEHYTIEEPQHKRVLCVEIGVEATRNPVVGEIFRSVDSFCKESLAGLLERAKAEGKIRPDLDCVTVAETLCVIGDGMFWRRAIDPSFDAGAMLPVLNRMIAGLLNPVPLSDAQAADAPAKPST
jgi:TetR/AcrR family transcriptional regulator, repressor for uid operon